jgi:predicted nucleic acid-binding protein
MNDIWATLSTAQRVCLDTSIFIYYFNRHEPHFKTCVNILRAVEEGSMRATLSVVSEMELLVAPIAEGKADIVFAIKDLLRRLNGLEIVPVDRGLAQRAAEMRAESRLRGLDALVATAGILRQCRYIVGNDREFARRVTQIEYLVLDDYV